jgi:hypothetical protein
MSLSKINKVKTQIGINAAEVFFVLIAAVMVYKPGFAGPFVFDDYINIVNNFNLRIEDISITSLYRAATSIPNGVFGRPISMISFAFNNWSGGAISDPVLSPYWFKVTNFSIHLINGLLIFFIVKSLKNHLQKSKIIDQQSEHSNWLAITVIAAWLLHPFNLTGVLYVVQRMTSLSAMFTLIGILTYIIGRKRMTKVGSLEFIKLVFLEIIITAFAFLSKENGVLLPLYIFLIEYCFFKFEMNSRSEGNLLKIVYIIFLIIPLVVGVVLLINNSSWIIDGYKRRDFNLYERLLTEARAICFYIGQILLPDVSKMGLYHDDFSISHGILEPPTTLVAIVVLICMTAVIFYKRKNQPFIVFGLGFFIIGHLIESTFIPLELIHEHRNYLPSFGLLLAASQMLLGNTNSSSIIYIRRIGALGLIMLFAIDTHSRSIDWSSSENLWRAEARNHPVSARTNVAQGDYYAGLLTLNPLINEFNYSEGSAAYDRALKVDEYYTPALFGLIKLGRNFEKPINDKYILNLKYALENKKLPANTNDGLIDMAVCTAQNQCPISQSEFENIIASALRNKGLLGREKALIYSADTFYNFQIKQNYDAALLSAQRAVALDGDIAYQIWIANIYAAMHKKDLAIAQVELLNKMDKYHANEAAIQEIRAQIELN